MAKKSDFRARQLAAKVQQQTVAALRTGDSFTNFGAKLGYGAGSQQDGSRYALDFISRNRLNLEAAYRTNWICGQLVDLVAQDMTRAGVEFKSDELDPDDLEKLGRALDRMQVWDKLCDTLKWSRLYGGCIAVMLIDGQQPSTPLKVDTIAKGQFKGLLVLDRWMIQPSLNTKVTEYGPDLGQPKFYEVLTDASAMQGAKIHYSRVIRIDGLDLPYWQRVAENGWGQSVLERLWDRIVAFDSTTEGAAQLVYKAHLRTVSIEGLRDIIATGGKAMDGLVKQMEMIRQYQSNEGLTVLDAKDKFEAHSYTFAGLDNLLLQFGQQLSGGSQIPLVRLFGQSPSGMNATGESDLRTYYDGVAQQQDRKLRSGLSRIFDVLIRSELGVETPEGFGFDFRPLWQLTDKEKADIAKVITDAIVAAEAAGLISQAAALKELRQSSHLTGVYSNITDDDIEAADDEPPAPADIAPPEAAAFGGPLQAVK